MEKITSQPLEGTFADVQPFPYIVIDDFLKPEIAERLSADFPFPDDDIWYEYDNILEKKLASDDLRKFPKSIAQAIHYLNNQPFIHELEYLTGIRGLQSDPYLHGGGLHCITLAGKLDMHVDYAIHPKLGLERRLNLILYLNEDWQEAWGGGLELWDGDWKEGKPELKDKKITIYPKFNRAVIFETGDSSFHGHPDALECPEGIYRKSIALYYLTEPREGITQRTRAHFIARHGIDLEDEETELFRVERSNTKGIY